MILQPKHPLDNRLLKVGGCLGLFSHLFYYYTWVYLLPQPYESFWLRLSCGVVSIPLILVDFWPEKAKKLIPLYWNIFLMHVLTITCTYLTLKNDFSTMWMMTQVMVVFTLSILIDEIVVLFTNILIGVLIATLTFYAGEKNEAINSFPHTLDNASMALIPVILACSLLFNYTKKRGIAAQEKANVLKSLAGSIAHEMRNPLSQINGVLHLLWDKKNNGAESDVYLNGLKQVINSSFQLIDLTMDAINDKPIKKEDFKIISALDICNEAVSEYAYKESAYRQKVSVTGGNFQVLADPVLMKYILYNLIGNALYYVQNMPDANIVISMLPVTRQIEVRDTGPGVAPESITKLFDSFFTSGKSGGTGLGLAYCKRTMQALDGDIHCVSELGKFTSFILSFPKIPTATNIVKSVREV